MDSLVIFQLQAPICFVDNDFLRRPTPHRDPLVIAMDITKTVLWRVFMDTRSSVNILNLTTFEKFGLTKKHIRSINTSLSGFTRDLVQAEGPVTLLVEVREYP